MDERSEAERQAARSYVREFAPAVLGYAAALVTVVLIVDFDTAGWWKYPLALLPVVPALWGVTAISRHVGRIDEMQRSMMLEGIAVGFGLAMVAAMTVGFLSLAGLDVDKWGPWAIYSIGMVGWILGQAHSSRSR